MPRLRKKTKIHLIAFVISLVLFVVVAYSLQAEELFSLPYLFAGALMVEGLLLILMTNELFYALNTPLRISWSLIQSAWVGMLGNPYLIDLKKKYPRFFSWLHRRFLKENSSGIFLTIGVVISIILLYVFLGVTQDVVLHDSIVRADDRVLNLIPFIRTPSETVFFTFMTFMASWPAVVFTTLLAGALLLSKKQRFQALLLVTAVLSTQGIESIIKVIVGRGRPDPVLSIAFEPSFSFPSGHVLMATVLFGLLSYFIIRSFRNTLPKILVSLTCMLVIFLVGLSRLYLGVHYPSDVLGSIVLGAFLLNIFTTLFALNQRYQIITRDKAPLSNTRLLLIPLFLIAFSLFFSRDFTVLRTVAPEEHFSTVKKLDVDTIAKLPHYSEGLTGNAMEPISFIVASTPDRLEKVFLDHGWYRADAATLGNTLKAIVVAVRNEQYLTGPVTPVFIKSKPNDLAFEQPTATGSFRQRHHTRFWKTDFILPDGRNIWVATASLDKDIRLTDTYKLPTHAIDPNIDAERDYIVESLGVKNAPRLQVVDPQLGKNAAGDTFFTDGKAVIIELK